MVDMDVLARPDVNGVVEGSVETAMTMLQGMHRFTGAPIPRSSMPVVLKTWRPRSQPPGRTAAADAARAGWLSTVGVHRIFHRSDCTGWSCSN
jgi:hypothetical protein